MPTESKKVLNQALVAGLLSMAAAVWAGARIRIVSECGALTARHDDTPSTRGLLRMLPLGTHDYARFVKPSELAAFARAAGLEALDLTGMTSHPVTREYRLGRDPDVNYIAAFRRPS